MMAGGLLLAILWSGWMVVGTALEGREMIADFGDVYRRDQRQVPMLVPWLGPVSVRLANATDGPDLNLTS
jgi:protein-S-isoprenylcysteine O-methyltransferase Ste14